MDEYTLPAGNEGVQVAVIDQHNGDGAWVQSSYLEQRRDVHSNRILDLRVANEGDLTLRERVWRDSDIRTGEYDAKNDKTEKTHGSQAPLRKDCSDAHPTVQTRCHFRCGDGFSGRLRGHRRAQPHYCNQ